MSGKSVRALYAKYPENIVDQRESVVIAQVWPLSFCDSNKDGIGDIRGVTQKAGYIAGLADVVWMSPFYPSPEGAAGDNGYARTHDREVEPKLGTIKDLRKMVDKFHEFGKKVIFDYAPCHTSDQHPDFIKSAARVQPYDKHYVWHPGRVDENGIKQPPNNWLNVYNNSAWCLHKERGEYYLNKFLDRVQPALDNNRPDVQEKNIETMKFWMREIRHDGWRLDAIPFLNHMSLEGMGNDVDTKSNHNWMYGTWPFIDQRWDNQWLDKMMCRPETGGIVKNMATALADYAKEIGLEKPFILAEAIAGRKGGFDSLPVASEYKKGVDACYTDETLFFEYPSAARMRGTIDRIEQFLPGGKNCNPIGNHDFPRFESRIKDVPAAARRQLRELMYCLPGDVCFMAGAEELGLKQGNIPEGLRKDWGGRDPERTPPGWNSAAENAGFTKSKTPYLPVSSDDYAKAVNVQEGNPNSMLNYMRNLYRWRSAQPALRKGQTIVIENEGNVLAFLRISKEQTMLCTFNMSGKEVSFTPSDHMDRAILAKLGLRVGQSVQLDEWGSEMFGTKRFDKHLEMQSKVRAPLADSSHRPQHRPIPVSAGYAANAG
ncbi:MAG: alpha-amylase family glycosyl hydrolase [Pseudomonadota bacterium]|nr:alpha-amylase family glycosyl hydrolase [Pseudomonadota bacterium]